MTILAEITDKMPSILEIAVTSVLASGVCIGIAMAGRTVAWTMFAIATLLGGLFSYAAATEAFVAGDFRDAIWDELGWSWVLAITIGPLVPAMCVTFLLLTSRRGSGLQGFPIGSPEATPEISAGRESGQGRKV